MTDILYSIYVLLFQPIIIFITEEIGISLVEIDFKIGFGSVEWFSLNLQTLFELIFGILISVIFLSLVWKVFKFFTKLTRKAFGKW